MFTFFSTNAKNHLPVKIDNILFNLVFMMISVLSFSPLIEAQRGGGSHGGGWGGGGHVYSGSGSTGSCDNKCLRILVGAIAVLFLFACLVAILYKKCTKTSSQMDNSFLLKNPHENPQQLPNSVDSAISIVNNLHEYSDIIDNLKLNPSALNSLWEGTYVETPGLMGSFNPKLIFKWNEQKNLMEFETLNDEQDEYGEYRILKGTLSFENGNFLARKYYFKPSQQTDPYTIIQKGHINFIIKNDQLCITAIGSWYSSYKNSVKGTFEYSKVINELTLIDKQKSYGTFSSC